jgi:multidrug efflux pump subunit AcrB
MANNPIDSQQRDTFPIVSEMIFILSANIIGRMNSQQTLVIFALVTALGLVTVVAVDVILTIQEAEAQKPRGCNRSVAANASQGRCVEPGKP